jgi:hypothetical protein
VTQRHGNSDSIARLIARELRSGNKLKATMPDALALMCSYKPRPSVQSNRGYKNTTTGQSIWGRDVYHAADAADKSKTLCGVDSSEWLTISQGADVDLAHTMQDFHFCTRCRKKLVEMGVEDVQAN